MTNTYRLFRITIESKMRRHASRLLTLAPISPVVVGSISSTRFKQEKKYYSRVALMRTKTDKLVVLQVCSSGSILVRVGVTTLPSLAIASAGTLITIKWNMWGDAIIWFF